MEELAEFICALSTYPSTQTGHAPTTLLGGPRSWAVTAIPCSLARVGNCKQSQHSPAPNLGLTRMQAGHSPKGSLKPACAGSQGIFLLLFWSQQACPTLFTLQLPCLRQQMHTNHMGDIHCCPSPSDQGSWHSWALRDYNIWKVLGRPTPPGHCTNSRLKHTSSLLVKRPIYLSWSFSLRDTHIEAMEVLPENISKETPSMSTTVASLQLNDTSQKEAATDLEPWFLQLLLRGHI